MGKLRGGVALGLLYLSIQVFIPDSSWAKREFIGLPKVCERTLSQLVRDQGAGGEAFNRHVDWSGLRENMQALGYPEQVIEEKLQGIEWDSDSALGQIRSALGRPKWKWGYRLTAADSRTIGSKLPYKSIAFVQALPYWASINGFDASLALNAHFKAQSGVIVEGLQKALAQSAPLWLKGEHGLENAKIFFERTREPENRVDSIWLLRLLSEKDQPAFKAYLLRKIRNASLVLTDAPGDQAESALTALSVLPWKSLPRLLRGSLEKHWIDLKKYPPIEVASIHHIARGYEFAGSCSLMTSGHLSSLGFGLEPPCSSMAEPATERREPILVSVQGQLVGSVKFVGESSMLALQNVFDAQGRLVLALGGVYQLSKDALDEISQSTETKGQWGRINLDSLQVHPSTFMLNEEGWADENLSLLITMARDSLTKDQLLLVIQQMSNQNNMDLRIRLHHQVWSLIIDKLAQLRREFNRH